jgi:hypothetical protein
MQVALHFMREAERFDPSQAVSVFALLQQVGSPEEVQRYTHRILNGATSR